ncbi:MAG: hypothetical protein AAFZ15_07450 [Bacteroidota bacterium]
MAKLGFFDIYHKVQSGEISRALCVRASHTATDITTEKHSVQTNELKTGPACRAYRTTPPMGRTVRMMRTIPPTTKRTQNWFEVGTTEQLSGHYNNSYVLMMTGTAYRLFTEIGTGSTGIGAF